jgi:hypothetical protein
MYFPEENPKQLDQDNPSSLPVDNKKHVSVTSSVYKPSKNHKGSNMWCHYCDKNNDITADCRAIAKFKQQKKAQFKAKARPRNEVLSLPCSFRRN